MHPAFARAQRGGALGTLVILVVVAVAGYYVYTEWFQEGRTPSCKEADQACIKNCRRTSTDQDSIAACQKECQRKLDACK
jgi:hypothetical protein